MPFAVHLTSANLAGMEPGTILDRTQIIQGDSLPLIKGRSYLQGLQLDMFPTVGKALTTAGAKYDVELENVATILMNPPFTKVERGIQQYVDMQRFREVCGGEVGLWGHFMALANNFVNDGGTIGAVLPINLLRGRESAKVRELVFSKWSPLYVVKSVYNYGFSEWAEYRDILLIARKEPPPANHRVKFALVKHDLATIAENDIYHTAQMIKAMDSYRDEHLDVESFSIEEIRQRFDNLMWFCGGSDFRDREILVSFVDRFEGRLELFPQGYFREGYRPVPKGVSSFLFLTRNLDSSRIEEAFLSFDAENYEGTIKAQSKAGVDYEIEQDALTRSLRTNIGLTTMDISQKCDYIATRPYRLLRQVTRASGFHQPVGFQWDNFWTNLVRETDAVATHVVALCRVNPYSPNTYLFSFFSDSKMAPSNLLEVIKEIDPIKAKAVCALLNSSAFLSQFFLLKEESTGRYIHIRAYDLEQMMLFPKEDTVDRLAAIFDRFRTSEFPSLREQLDTQFDQRYKDYWDERRRGLKSLFSVLSEPVKPAAIRLAFDQAVCEAVGVSVSTEELRALYAAIVREMIITRGLKSD